MKQIATGVLLVVMLAGCGSATPPDSGPPAIGELPVIRTVADLRLPMDQYLRTQRERATVETARDELVSRCMAEHGYPGYPVPDHSNLLLRPLHGNKFGLFDEAEATANAFTPTWVEEFTTAANGSIDPLIGWHTPEVVRALEGALPAPPPTGPAATAEVEQAPPAPRASRQIESYDEEYGYTDDGGCRGRARTELLALGARTEYDLLWVSMSAEQQFAFALDDPRMEPVNAAWATCMQQAGYPYRNRIDATEDRRWSDHPPEEKVAAIASVRCTQSSRYVDTLVALTAAYQERFIEKNAERLDDELEFKDALLAAIAAQGLGRIGGDPGGPPPVAAG